MRTHNPIGVARGGCGMFDPEWYKTRLHDAPADNFSHCVNVEIGGIS